MTRTSRTSAGTIRRVGVLTVLTATVVLGQSGCHLSERIPAIRHESQSRPASTSRPEADGFLEQAPLDMAQEDQERSETALSHQRRERKYRDSPMVKPAVRHPFGQ